MKCSHRSSEDLWQSDGTGADLFACVMSERRFRFLLRCIRFDDIRGRTQRKEIDKITHIRWIFDNFVSNCKKSYSISEYACVDEKLQSFRGRCSFRQYIPNKPAKYGIKMFALCDNGTYYTSNLEIYAGKQPDGPFSIDNSASEVVKRLVSPISKTGRNITADNWFASVSLAEELLKNHNLTLVATIKKNKREIPKEFLVTKNRELCSSYFGFQNNMSIVSYMPKKNKIVLVLSTMHSSKTIDESSGLAKKPEIITFYNATKGAVDNMDRMTENYTVARRSNRWPLTVFYSILNIGAVNSQVIYHENSQTKYTRLQFLKILAKQLMDEQLQYRATILSLPKNIKTRLNIYGYKPTLQVGEQRVRASGRCQFCERQRDRKTTKVCTNCAKLICRDHLVEVCPECFSEM